MDYSGKIHDFVDLLQVEAALTSTYHSWLLTRGENIGLFDFLKARNLELQAKGANPDLNATGVFVNGKRANSNLQLRPPCKIEVYRSKQRLDATLEKLGRFDPSQHIIFEDQYLACVFKPYKIHSMPAKDQNYVSFYKDLRSHFRSEIHLPSRLDFATCGLMLISKVKDFHRALQQLFENREISKKYLLSIATAPDWETITCKFNILPDLRHPVLRKASLKSGKSAETRFSFLGQSALGSYLLQAEPITGRTHQIRVHAAAMGYPIIGDRFYGGEEAEQLYLLSQGIEFVHPASGKKLTFQVPDSLFPEWLKSFGSILHFQNA